MLRRSISAAYSSAKLPIAALRRLISIAHRLCSARRSSTESCRAAARSELASSLMAYYLSSIVYEPLSLVMELCAIRVSLQTAFAGRVRATWLADYGEASSLWLIGFLVLVAFGELYVWAAGLSLVLRVAPTRVVSLMMGLWLAMVFIADVIENSRIGTRCKRSRSCPIGPCRYHQDRKSGADPSMSDQAKSRPMAVLPA